GSNHIWRISVITVSGSFASQIRFGVMPRKSISACSSARTWSKSLAASALANRQPRVSAKRFHPALEPPRLTRHELRIAQRVGQQRRALNAGDERHGEVAGIPASHLAELALRTVEQRAQKPRSVLREGLIQLVELRHQAPKRTAVGRHHLRRVGPRAGEALQPSCGVARRSSEASRLRTLSARESITA